MHISAIVLLAAVGVHGRPRERLPSYILPANWTLTPYREPSAFRNRRRQDGRVDCEVGGGDVVAQDLNAGPGESPQAFAQLFDYLESDLCTGIACQFDQEYCVTASTGSDVCIQAQGNYERNSRDAFLRSTRGSFDRTVRRLEPGQGVIETGSNFINFQSRQGPLGIGDLQVRLRNVASDGGPGAGCGAVISTIAAAGNLFPQVSAPFGALTFFCGTADRFEGIATG